MKVALQRIGFIFILILPALFVQNALQSGFLADYIETIQTYLPLYLGVILVLKSLSIVYPPLPGAVFTLSSIPLIGWELAYIVDIVGSTIGASLSYILGRRYGYAILLRVLGLNLTEKIIAIRLKQKNQVEAAFFLRFAAGGLLSDGLAWGASLIGFRLTPFILGYALSHVLITLPIFYFVGVSLSVDSWLIFILVAVFAWFILLKFKGRYFE